MEVLLYIGFSQYSPSVGLFIKKRSPELGRFVCFSQTAQVDGGPAVFRPVYGHFAGRGQLVVQSGAEAGLRTSLCTGISTSSWTSQMPIRWGMRSGLRGGQSCWVLHLYVPSAQGTLLGEKGSLRMSVSLLVREAAPCSVCLNKLLPGFCISHKEFTKVGLIQIWWYVNLTSRGFPHLHPHPQSNHPLVSFGSQNGFNFRWKDTHFHWLPK